MRESVDKGRGSGVLNWRKVGQINGALGRGIGEGIAIEGVRQQEPRSHGFWTGSTPIYPYDSVRCEFGDELSAGATRRSTRGGGASKADTAHRKGTESDRGTQYVSLGAQNARPIRVFHIHTWQEAAIVCLENGPDRKVRLRYQRTFGDELCPGRGARGIRPRACFEGVQDLSGRRELTIVHPAGGNAPGYQFQTLRVPVRSEWGGALVDQRNNVSPTGSDRGGDRIESGRDGKRKGRTLNPDAWHHEAIGKEYGSRRRPSGIGSVRVRQKRQRGGAHSIQDLLTRHGRLNRYKAR
ncbi:MAG: hypothetical protein ACI80V_001533 [Rhodothermales bacterium]|jgi:hypothetical protein